MLIVSRDYVAEHGGDPRDLGLYGQDDNGGVWAICKMNMLLHGIQGADIENDDTLAHPRHRDGGELMRFDRVISNPPFSQNYSQDGMDYKERFVHGFAVSAPSGRRRVHRPRSGTGRSQRRARPAGGRPVGGRDFGADGQTGGRQVSAGDPSRSPAGSALPRRAAVRKPTRRRARAAPHGRGISRLPARAGSRGRHDPARNRRASQVVSRAARRQESTGGARQRTRRTASPAAAAGLSELRGIDYQSLAAGWP